MNLQNSKLRLALLILLALTMVISYRIYSNIQKEKSRASSIGARQVQVVTGQPQRLTLVPQLRFTGSLDPVWQAQLAAKVDGRLEQVYVAEGDRVEQGQLLARLEQQDTNAALINAQGSYTDAKINLQKAQKDLDRYEQLFAKGAVSQQVVDNYRFARDNAAAKLEAAGGNLASMESKAQATALTAPAAGIIAKRFYQEGYYAKAGTAIFAIADLSALKTIVHIPEGQISSVAVGNKALITLPAYNGKRLEGEIVRIAPVASLPDHSFEAEISVPNEQGLRAGIFAQVELQAQPKENVLTIPIHAIVMRDDQQTVFVADKEGVVQRRVLAIGYMDDKVAQVISGLDEKETIVVEGHHKLREGSRIKVKEAGK